MILNATILRLDLPDPNPIGPTVSIRCCVAPPTVEQARISVENGWGATAMMYIPLAHVPSPRPTADGHVLVRAKGEETTYEIKQVQQRIGAVLGHIVMYLAPT